MQRVVRLSLAGLLAFAGAGLTACGDKVTIPAQQVTPKDSVVHSVVVSPAQATVAVGSTITLAAAVDAGAGVTNRGVTWSSSDATVATVSAAGVVTGVKQGTVTIIAASAADANVKGAAAITVGGANTGAPTVTISAINQNNGVTSVPANLANAGGQLDIVLNVEPNGQTLKTVQATMTCGTKSLNASQTVSNLAPVAAEASAVPITLSFNTAAFNPTTGAVALNNGPCTISASATTTSGTQSATSGTQLTLNNQDGVVISSAFAAVANAEGVTPAGTQATDAQGLPWKTGATTISAVPVLYSGRTVSSVSITLPGANTATQTVTAAPFSATWSATSTSGANVTRLTLVGAGLEANGITPVGIAPSVVALDANGNDLALNVLNPGIVGTSVFRLDNTGPQPPTTFITPLRQGGWVNASYKFTGVGINGGIVAPTGATNWVGCGDGPAAAAAAVPVCAAQIGVSTGSISGNSGINGQTTFSYYAIPAGSYSTISATGTGVTATACSTTGWTKLASGTAGDLAASGSNTAYVVRTFETDKLGNARCTDVASAPQNINSTVAFVNGKFGVDKVPPTAVYIEPSADPTAAGANGVLAVGGNIANFNIKIGLSDDASGFSGTPISSMITRLAVSPTTLAPASPNSAFGCPSGISSGACAATSTTANIPGNANGITDVNNVVYAASQDASGACLGCGYFTFTQTALDLARNAAPTLTRSVVIDQLAPTVGGIAVPATVVGGTSASFATSAADNLDLISSDFTLTYAANPTGNPIAALPIRAAGPALGVAFDNVLTTASSFSVNVPFFVRNIATTGAADAPQNNGALPNQMTVRVYDAAGNASAPGVAAIAAANVPQTGLTNFTVAPAGANPLATMISFAEANAVANISNCPAAGCAGNAAPANPTTVTLTAASTGNEGATFQFINPFTSIQFYYFDTVTNEWILIGSAVAPVVTDNAGVTVRTFTWTLSTPFDPPAALGAGTTLKVIAIGVNAAGDALASAVNANITLTNP